MYPAVKPKAQIAVDTFPVFCYDWVKEMGW